MKDWCFSIVLLPIYLATFLLWQQLPSRACFLVGGFGSAVVMSAGCMWAVKRHYFVDKADLAFHAFVILDVIIEGSLYEAARLAGYVAADETELLLTLHNGNNFYGCAIAFMLVIGFHRWRVMRSKRHLQRKWIAWPRSR